MTQPVKRRRTSINFKKTMNQYAFETARGVLSSTAKAILKEYKAEIGFHEDTGEMLRRAKVRTWSSKLKYHVGVIDKNTGDAEKNRAHIALFMEIGTKDRPATPYLQLAYNYHTAKMFSKFRQYAPIVKRKVNR